MTGVLRREGDLDIDTEGRWPCEDGGKCVTGVTHLQVRGHRESPEARRKARKVLQAACVPPNSYMEALTPSVAVFGNGASKKVIKVN